MNEVIEFMMIEIPISHIKSAPYHPEENVQAKGTNKTLCTTLTKVVSESWIDYEQNLHSIL